MNIQTLDMNMLGKLEKRKDSPINEQQAQKAFSIKTLWSLSEDLLQEETNIFNYFTVL